MHQPADGDIEIQRLARPARHRRARRDSNAGPLVSGDKRIPVDRRRRRTLEGLTVRPQKPECPVIERLHDDLAFVDPSMMETAECHEVGQLCLPAMGPVLHVVPVHIALERAAGETAALVPGVQRAPNGRRDGASLSADIQRLTVVSFDDPDHAAVAGEPASCLRGYGRPLLELATARMRVPEGLGIHVHHDLLAIGP